jgi:hypothetical protein
LGKDEIFEKQVGLSDSGTTHILVPEAEFITLVDKIEGAAVPVE